jgi:NAD(P)-dependent dehydrogenase (short-subunit alcohol dehydrogenase family)
MASDLEQLGHYLLHHLVGAAAVPAAPASDNARLRHLAKVHGRGDLRRRAFMSTTLYDGRRLEQRCCPESHFRLALYEIRNSRNAKTRRRRNCKQRVREWSCRRPGAAASTATKHGVHGLTKSAALQYAKQGIRINAVAPGAVRTPLALRGTEQYPGYEAAMLAAVPQGRWCEPEEIAETVLFLCSDRAMHIIGAIVSVDGGLTTY